MYKKVFEAFYGIANEKTSNFKIFPLLQLAERLKVDDIELFKTRSEILVRKMLIHIGNVL